MLTTNPFFRTAPLIAAFLLANFPVAWRADTVALWLFDEQDLKLGCDISELSGHPVRLVARMRCTSLYALQFATK